MYSPIARDAHINARQMWDSVTSALGRVLAVDDPLTTTTVVVKTVTAGQAEAKTTTTVKAQTTTRAASTRTTTARPTTTANTDGFRAKAAPTTSSTLPTAFVPLETDNVSDTTLALAPSTTRAATTTEAATTEAIADQANTASGSRSSATSPPQVDQQRDNNNVVTAGIVIGVLAGVLAIFVLVWALFNRRRKQLEKKRMAEQDDEKINGPINPFADSAAIRTPTTAPRLSLRPVTQFLPTFPDRRVSRGANMMLSAEPQGQNSPLHKPAGASAWERPTLNSTNNGGAWDRSGSPSNPFGDSQRIPEETERDLGNTRPVSPPSPPQASANLAATSNQGPEPVSPIDGARQEFPTGAAVAAGAVAGAAATGAAAGLVRKASIRKDLPRPLDLTMPMPPAMSGAPAPPSPAGTEFSMHSVAPGQPIGPSSSAAAIAAAGGPPQSTVHRVTLDFKPTLEDEMGLTAGQLVRLLHEYDDGWALCIRLDRSQQGVVPRTCLSTRPVKPRPPPGGPRGPPVNPNRGYPPHQGMGARNGPPPNGPYGRPQSPYGRPPSSQSSVGPPMSPVGGRPMSPYGARPASPGGRAMSPGPGQRSQSPGPRYQQQGRPQSPSGMNRRMSPPGPSNMSRGPVPGQAY